MMNEGYGAAFAPLDRSFRRHLQRRTSSLSRVAASLCLGAVLLRLGTAPGIVSSVVGFVNGRPWPADAGAGKTARSAFNVPGFSVDDVRKAAGDMFGGGDDEEDESKPVEVPEDVAAMVNGMKAATTEVLNQGISRLDIEAPPSFKFGVEGDKGRLLEELGEDDRKELVRSDREMARLFVEMLQPIGPGLCIAFRNKAMAERARKIWKLQPGEGNIISFPEKAKNAFSTEMGGPIQFKSKLRDLNCQCLIAVGPYIEELRIINEIDKEVRDQMGIIMLNSRIFGRGRKTQKLPATLKADLLEAFLPAYHVRFLEQKNTLLFHMVKGTEPERQPWIIAKQRELIGGRTVTEEIARMAKEPGPKKIAKILDDFASKEKDTKDQVLDLLDKDTLLR
eukprot:TRINITY_DN188_c0_g2_i1.p1 TRINITY_DN188_c0_g2~~TRINITY_DN188_c0_g2_i1.p1  ORF type:complete len:393 (-),score=105.11 TRINITY_DN188_c0_g2_i1:100-1278(-)